MNDSRIQSLNAHSGYCGGEAEVKIRNLMKDAALGFGNVRCPRNENSQLAGDIFLRSLHDGSGRNWPRMVQGSRHTRKSKSLVRCKTDEGSRNYGYWPND